MSAGWLVLHSVVCEEALQLGLFHCLYDLDFDLVSFQRSPPTGKTQAKSHSGRRMVIYRDDVGLFLGRYIGQIGILWRSGAHNEEKTK